MYLQVKKLVVEAKLPAKNNNDDIGLDICCVADDNFYTVVEGNQYSVKEQLYGIELLKDDNHYDCLKTHPCDNYNISVGDKIYFFHPHTAHIFKTGIACQTEPGWAALLWDRSGMGAVKHIHRFAGVIDTATYRGEWLVALMNFDNEPHIIKAGDKIVQAIIQKVEDCRVIEVAELSDTERGTKGFGSSGS